MSDQENILLITPFEEKEEQLVEFTSVKGTKSKKADPPPAEKEKKETDTNTDTGTGTSANTSRVANKFTRVAREDPDSIRDKSLQDNINLVAAARAYHNSEEESGKELKTNVINNLENKLEDLIEDTLGDDFRPDKFRERYLTAVDQYSQPIVTDKRGVVDDLLRVKNVDLNLKQLVLGFLKAVQREIDPVGAADIGEAGGDYLLEVFKDFGQFAADEILNAKFLDTNEKSCVYSHPYATAFAMLAGSSYGGFIDRPIWSKIIGLVTNPVTAPLRVAKGLDKSIRVFDKVPYAGMASRGVRYGTYAALAGAVLGTAGVAIAAPDDAEELNKYRKALKEKINGFIGEIPLEGVVGMIADYLDETIGQTVPKNFGARKTVRRAAAKTVDKKSQEIKNNVRTGLEAAAEKTLDDITANVPTTRLEWKDMVSSQVVKKFNKATAVTASNKGHMNSMNCYLYSVAGAFLLSNIAKGPIKKASFAIRTSFSGGINSFTETVATMYRETRLKRIQMFKLKKGNDLAAYLVLRNIPELNQVILDELGDIRMSKLLDKSPGLVLYKASPSGAVVNSAGEIIFSADLLPTKVKNKLKPFIQLSRSGNAEMLVLKTDIIQKQLRQISTPVFERSMEELTKTVDEVYRTGQTINRIRNLSRYASQIGLSAPERLKDHYRTTASLVQNMLSKRKDGVLVFKERLKELEKRYARFEKTATSANIASDDIIAAVKKFEADNPGEIATFPGIKPYLEKLDVKLDQRLRSLSGGGTVYEELIRDIRIIDQIETEMITEFRLIDEAFRLEKKMLKKIGSRLPPGDAKNFEDYLSGVTGTPGSDSMLKQFVDLYTDFERIIVQSRLGNYVNLQRIKALSYMAEKNIEVAWALGRLSEKTVSNLRTINLKNIEQAFKDDPVLASALATAAATNLYEFLDYLIQHLSGIIQESASDIPDGEMLGFIGFLTDFSKQVRRIRNKEKDRPWLMWLQDFKSTKDVFYKIDMLITLFKGIQEKSSENLKENRIITMKKTDLQILVSEMLNENTGAGYANYPYASNEYSEEEPDEDYMTEWKSLVDEVCSQKKRNIDGDPNTAGDPAIEVAKLLVKDLDLFREVLELAGNNKSVGTEIMSQLKSAKEKYIQDPKV